MPALFFPNLNVLRLALANGLVPAAISQAPAAAGFDSHGQLWLQPTVLPPRESLAVLARLGVQALGGSGVPTVPVSCWAALLPLQAASEPAPVVALFLVPDRQVARFAARLRRTASVQVSVRLPDLTPAGPGWVIVRNPPAGVLLEAAETDSSFEAFREQAPGLWVRLGWRHPLPDHFPISPGSLLLVRPPRSVVAVAAQISSPDPDEYRLHPIHVPQPAQFPPRPAIAVRLTLVPARSPRREVLWVLDEAGEAAFWAFCAATDERITRTLEVAPVAFGSTSRLVVRASGKKKGIFAPLPGAGFAPDERVPGLFVPANRALRPVVRARELTRILGVDSNRIVWIETGPENTVVPHAVAASTFRSVSELIEYTSPATNALEVPQRRDLFLLERFVAASEIVPVSEPEPDLLPIAFDDDEPIELGDEHAADAPGWLSRAVRRLFARFRPVSLAPEAAETEEPQPEPPRRIERKIASAEALLHGQDWSARRRELEGRLFRDLPRLESGGRAERWADLAALYSARGNATDSRNAADAAVCWLNAVWEAPEPPRDWLEDWLAAEGRAAELTGSVGGLERWLSEPGRPGVGRVVAAYTVLAASAANPLPEFRAALPRIIAFLEHHFDDLPVRAAWLARLAVARACEGDALGLARWRDRVLARLAESGPGLDLDEPSFLRFHGTASAERFQAARGWLEKMCARAVSWVKGQGRGSRLRFFGLDAEIECTAAYTQFLFAWGLGCLGERTRSREWAGKARKLVAHAAGPRIDPAVHAVLGDLFWLRVKEAQEGRSAKPGLPASLQARLEALPELARYSVERLRARSRILEPLDRIGPFRGLELKTFWGNDRLGERLSVLVGRTDRTQIADEANALLQLCVESPSSASVPRVVLTLLEVAPRLAPAVFLHVLDLVPTAIDWLEAWLASGPWTDAERPRTLAAYQARMIEAAFHAAGILPAEVVGAAVGNLIRRLLASGETLRGPLLSACGAIFRAVRRLGLRGEAEAIVRFLDPGDIETTPGPNFPLTRLGLAAGWFTAGDEDAGYRIVKRAQEALYLAGDATVAHHTALAVAYAEALGFAPDRIAHGHLEEIFQRSWPLKISGATNGYFTLQPLQLIDAVVRSVVSDEFTLSPAIRGWLDDDEFLIRGRIHRDLAGVLRENGIV